MSSDRLPPLSSLRVFEAAARLGSFSKAAEDLFVTPGAVSQQIRLLEDHVGAPLFAREGRRVSLTDPGRAALPLLRNAFELMAEAARVMRQPARKGRVTVSVAPSFAAKWLMPRLFEFNEAHPEIDVWVSADMAAIDFANADVDLAIRFGPGGYAGLHEEKLLSEAVLPVCSPILMEVAPISQPADLRHHTLLHDLGGERDPTCPDWAMWLKANGVADVDAHRGPRFNQSSLVIEAAVAGRGVALAKRTIASADLSAGRLVAPFAGPEAPVGFSYFLVWPGGRALSPAQAIFVDWLRAQARGAEPAFPPPEDGDPPVFAGQSI